MNIKNWSGKKKVFAIFLAVLLITGLVATIFIVQTRLETRTRAEKATILSLTPASQTTQANQQITLDVNIDPGTNQVDYVKMVINFDPEKFDSNSTSFTLDPDTKFQRTADDVVTSGQIAITLDVGSSPTNVITVPQKIGTLNLLVNQESEALAGETQISFDETSTQVRSIASGDVYQENVLSSTSPATVNIEAVCRPNIATCSWDPVDGAILYHYVITDVEGDQIVSEGDTPETSIEFDSLDGVTYSCSVTAANACDETGLAGEGIGTCGAAFPTPTATPSGTLTPTPTTAPTAVPTDVPTSTPTLTPIPTTAPTATPTDIVYDNTTEYTDNSTPTTTYTQVTPTPSLAPTGNPMVIAGGIIGGVLVLIGGLLLLAL